MNKTLETVTFCKRSGERVSIPKLFMEVREAHDDELIFDVQNYEVGTHHKHLWDFLEGFEGNGSQGKIELTYSDEEKHLYRCKDFQMQVLQQGRHIGGHEDHNAVGRIDLKLGKEVH
jgi:hypothetical protein